MFVKLTFLKFSYYFSASIIEEVKLQSFIIKYCKVWCILLYTWVNALALWACVCYSMFMHVWVLLCALHTLLEIHTIVAIIISVIIYHSFTCYAFEQCSTIKLIILNIMLSISLAKCCLITAFWYFSDCSIKISDCSIRVSLSGCCKACLTAK